VKDDTGSTQIVSWFIQVLTTGASILGAVLISGWAFRKEKSREVKVLTKYTNQVIGDAKKQWGSNTQNLLGLSDEDNVDPNNADTKIRFASLNNDSQTSAALKLIDVREVLLKIDVLQANDLKGEYSNQYKDLRSIAQLYYNENEFTQLKKHYLELGNELNKFD